MKCIACGSEEDLLIRAFGKERYVACRTCAEKLRNLGLQGVVTLARARKLATDEQQRLRQVAVDAEKPLPKAGFTPRPKMSVAEAKRQLRQMGWLGKEK
jgi:hypothetical protein